MQGRYERGAASMSPAQGRILIVDDNPVNQMVAARAVQSLGYTAEMAAGADQALAAVARDRFDLILMDCHMPGMDGYEASRRIRQEEGSPGRVPIIAMTADATEEDPDKCLDAGMNDYLSKPVRLASLSEALERWLPSPACAMAEDSLAASASPAPACPRPPSLPSGRPPTPPRGPLLPE